MKLEFRVHAVQRMFERAISRDDVAYAIENGETIESYPEDKPYPSRLLLTWREKRPLHVVAADNPLEETVYIITVYLARPCDLVSRFQDEKGKQTMKCVICKHGETAAGHVTVTLERGSSTIIFRDVPAQVCTNCGEAYLDDATTTTLLAAAEAALKSGVQVEIRSFAAA